MAKKEQNDRFYFYSGEVVAHHRVTSEHRILHFFSGVYAEAPDLNHEEAFNNLDYCLVDEEENSISLHPILKDMPETNNDEYRVYTRISTFTQLK